MWPQEVNLLKTRVYFSFSIFFKPIQMKNIKQMKTLEFFFSFFHFFHFFHLHLRPERLKTLLGARPGACPGHWREGAAP